jgi:hypothetical protein
MMPLSPINGPSAPGPSAQRTGQPIRDVTGLPYGDGKALREQQAAAPMAETPAIPITDLGAPTARPDQPITAGAPMGPGPGPEVLSTATGRPAGGVISSAIAKAAASDPSGELAKLYQVALSKGL